MSDKQGASVAAHSTSNDLVQNEAFASKDSSSAEVRHGAPEVVRGQSQEATNVEPTTPVTQGSWLSRKLQFVRTKNFWIITAIGQFLALAVTGTNTLSTLLNNEGTSIPAFQSLFLYVLLNIGYGGYTLYRYGLKKWAKMVLKDGWKYIILAFFDVQGNYFTVLAYRYTTILSAQLINFWAIVIVVAVSFVLLKVKYHWAQIFGIFICVGGMGILLASDHLQGLNGDYDGAISRQSQLKGDLFALVGATAYGLSNVYEEWFVSGRPLYEVIGQLGFWGTIIIGVQAAIFDRDSFQTATWNGQVGGYMTGYTLILVVFYSTVPVLYRLSSAAFFNISLLTSNFWGTIIGTRVFNYSVHWMYPIAFVLIIVGIIIYHLGKGVYGEAKKAWLGERQEKGISGFGTARRRIERDEVAVATAGVV